MSDERVLITGVSGFAGRHLAELSVSEGDDVVGVSRSGDAVPGTRVRALDLADAAAVDDLVRDEVPARVFHLAAEASVARSWQDRAGTIRRNLDASLHLLDALARHRPDARVLLACSGEEYGPPERLPVTEDHPLRPQNPYAVSKAAVDVVGRFYADALGLPVVRTRAFNHAGPGQSETYVVSDFARQLALAAASTPSGAAVEIVTGNVQARRDFTDVRDVVRAYRVALERAEPGAYNVCSGKSVAVADILAGLAEHAGLEVHARTNPERLRPSEVTDIHGSHDKLTSATGWRPEIPLSQTLADTLAWWSARVREEVPS